jgi:uncharacterized membrane protein
MFKSALSKVGSAGRGFFSDGFANSWPGIVIVLILGTLAAGGFAKGVSDSRKKKTTGSAAWMTMTVIAIIPMIFLVYIIYRSRQQSSAASPTAANQ